MYSDSDDLYGESAKQNHLNRISELLPLFNQNQSKVVENSRLLFDYFPRLIFRLVETSRNQPKARKIGTGRLLVVALDWFRLLSTTCATLLCGVPVKYDHQRSVSLETFPGIPVKYDHQRNVSNSLHSSAPRCLSRRFLIDPQTNVRSKLIGSAPPHGRNIDPQTNARSTQIRSIFFLLLRDANKIYFSNPQIKPFAPGSESIQ